MSDENGERAEPVDGSSEYDLMVELERLESLREEAEESGMPADEDLDRKITELHRQLDALDEPLGDQ